MSGGLVGLLDDIAALAKLAAASLDDVGAAAGKASVKAAGVVVDDTAVGPGEALSRLSWQIREALARERLDAIDGRPVDHVELVGPAHDAHGALVRRVEGLEAHLLPGLERDAARRAGLPCCDVVMGCA
jgi:hypothetical protein